MPPSATWCCVPRPRWWAGDARRYTLSHSGDVELRPRSGNGKAVPHHRAFHGNEAQRAEPDPLAR